MNHTLTGPPVRERSPYGDHYYQTCGCGVRCYGLTLWAVWEHHTRHLSRVGANG